MTSTDDRHTPELTGVIYGADGAPRAGLLSNCATPWRMSVVVTSVTMWSQIKSNQIKFISQHKRTVNNK